MQHNRDITLEQAWKVLRQRGWLAGRAPSTANAILNIARIKLAEEGELLYGVGDTSNGVYGLVEGGFAVSIPREDSQEFVLYRAEPGFWVGDSGVFSELPRLISLRATTASVFVFLPLARLKTLLQAQPAMMADFYQLTHRNTTTLLRIIGNLTVNPSLARVAGRLLFYAEKRGGNDPWITTSQDELARELALSIATFQRALRQLELQGLVETGYGRIRILNHAALAGICTEQVSRNRRTTADPKPSFD